MNGSKAPPISGTPAEVATSSTSGKKSAAETEVRPNAAVTTTFQPRPDTRPAPKTLAELQEQLGFPDLLDYFLSGAKAPAAIVDWAANLSDIEFRRAMDDLKNSPLSTGKFVLTGAVMDRWLKTDPQGCLDTLMKFTGGGGQELLEEASGKWKTADADAFAKWVAAKQAASSPPTGASPAPENSQPR